ncbi:MAG: acyl-CoA dehydrogenase [Syntrophomonadaceae bacterium]|nr:acyl-CoA dehydrogenase [Syntrophomonadaceae bacterium]
MAQQFFSRRNLQFMLYEVLQAEDLCNYEYFQDHSRDTFELIIDTVSKLATDVMYPVFQDMDSNPPVYADGIARVHPIVRNYMQECGAGGWINPYMSYEFGGQQLPSTVYTVIGFIMGAANYSLSAYPQLTGGAANLLVNFGSKELQDLYLAPMLAGQWQGTMALTEPNAGSSLADVKTSAEDSGQGYFLIKGQKIFITGGSTDATDNTVHMMLARIKGAPSGVKGISLFLVPKFYVDEAGNLQANDIFCTGIEHKLGYKGCPACQLSMGDNGSCRGYLIGEPNKGLAYMFQMMNEERVNVGIGAASKATAAYYAALEYAQQRLQGRKINDKNPESPQIAIINHADIKRMLMFQRAISEGALALGLQVSKYIDLAKAGEESEKNELLIDFLVPIVKTYPAEMGILATSAAIQCLGGYGYCKDFPVEQYFRDVRIDPIHEGTTGIQGQDLLGRKVIMKKGRAFQLFKEELSGTINTAAEIDQLKLPAKMLEEAMIMVEQVTSHLLQTAVQGDTERFLSDASLYLEMTGILTIGWQWLLQGVAACQALNVNVSTVDKNFYQGKMLTMQYYFDYEMPRINTLCEILTRNEGFMSDVPLETFV